MSSEQDQLLNKIDEYLKLDKETREIVDKTLSFKPPTFLDKLRSMADYIKEIPLRVGLFYGATGYALSLIGMGVSGDNLSLARGFALINLVFLPIMSYYAVKSVLGPQNKLNL